MSDPYLELEAEPNPYLDSSIPERAGNAAKAGAQGVVTSVGQAISGAARTADTIREGSLLTGVAPGTAKPTLRQSRRAFEQAMNDPRYMAALTEAGDDPAMQLKAEQFFGPKAKLDVIRTPIEEGRKMSAAESVAQQKRLDVDSPLYAFGRGLVEAGREVYATDPYLDLKPESKLTRSMGSTLPSVALSLIPGVGTASAVTQYALSQSEDMAQEAIDAGRPDLAMQSATAGLFIGALSEGALGATARLGTILKNPTKLAALEGWAKANPIKARAMIVGVREAAQEGVEQSMQNVTASDVVGYDPDRPWHRQVLEAMVLGGVGGSLFGLGGAGLQKLTQPKADEKAVALEELNRALDAFQAQPERVTTLDVAPPTIEGTQGELIPVPPTEEQAQPEILTPAQIMSREAVNAMAELRKLKEAAKQQGKQEPNADAVTIGTLPTQADVDMAAGRQPAIEGKAEPIPPRPEPQPEARAEVDSSTIATVVPAAPSQSEPSLLPADNSFAPSVAKPKRRPTLRPRPDGVPDILDAIAELGGIKAPGSQKGTAEYDGYAAAFNEGGPAAVATTEAGETNGIAQAKADVREAWDAFKVVGIMPDPKADARKVFDLYKALFKLASAYVKEGMKSAGDFAKKVGLKHDAVLDAAWNDAVAGKARSNPDELDGKVVSEIVEGFRDRKFSRRFAQDERVAPEIRQATGNAQYQEMPNALTVAEAFAVIQSRGIAEAQALMMDETNALSPRVRATIGQAVILQTNHDYGKTGDDTVLDRAVTVAEWLTEYGTRLGQGVQAFAIWNKLTPDGMVRTYIRTVQKAQQRVRKENPNAKPGELKIPEVDPETAKRIRKATAEAQNKPEGFQRDEAMADVLGMIAKARGISGTDLTIALWYANILSGYPSWLRNGMGNAGMLFAEAATHAVTRPQHVPAILTGLFHGIGVGVPQAIAVLRTGKQTGHRVGKIVESPRVLELVTFGRKGGLEGTTLSAPVRAALETPLAYPLNAWKYVFRIMSATDMIAFESAMEMHARFLAKELVRTGKADGRTYAQLLAQQAGIDAQARSQAAAEGLTGITYRRRIAEIIQQQRPETLQSAAAQDALYATFNQHPRGVLGAIAGHISELSNQWSALRLVIPFTNIVSNVLNNTLDYTPWGYRRLFPSVMLKDRAGERLNFMPEDSAPVDYQLQAARATLGTIGLAAIWALTQAHKDDDDPAFDVTARGPDNPNDREGLKETGWKPYSVKVGNRWVSYQQSVLAPGMAWIGSLRDAQRLKKWTDMEDWSRFAYAGKAIGPAIMSQSFVSGLRDFLQDISDDYIDPNGPKFKFASRSVGTLVPAAVKAVDRVMDPTIYDSQRFPAALLRDIPFVRSSQLKPALNALGEPVRPPDNFLYNIENPDPVWELLARKQAFPSKPSLTMVIRGRPITPDEQYSIIESSGPAIRRRIALRIPAYAVLPDEIVQKRIDDIVREERDNARSRLGLK